MAGAADGGWPVLVSAEVSEWRAVVVAERRRGFLLYGEAGLDSHGGGRWVADGG